MKFTRIAVLIVAALLTPFVAIAKAVTVLGSVILYHALEASPFGAPFLALGANTLTSLIPDVYAALDVVSRELTGFIPAVARDSTADRVALNQTLRGIQTPANAGGKNIVPAMSLPSASDQVIGNKSLTITKTRAFPFSWTGEEQKSVDAGPGYLTIKQDQIAQAIRAGINEVEADIFAAAFVAGSRAYGTAGTAPFGTNLGESAQMKKILDDNGAPASDRHLILDTTAGASLRTLAQLNRVNEAGDNTLLRQGLLLNLHNFDIRESAAINPIAAGTGASYTSNTAGYAIGATAITLITGTGTVLAGDVVTFTGDTNKYVVAVGVAAPGVITLAAPGLRKALAASAVAMTITAASTRNIAFSRNALILGSRLPAVPQEGDLAILREVVTDPRTGLSFELAVYPGYRMNVYEIGMAWGVCAFKPEHIGVLLG